MDKQVTQEMKTEITRDMALSIGQVEKTREARMKTEPRRMTAEEKDDLLRQYHPDYREDGFVVLQAGPNRGSKVPRELGALLQGESRVLNLKQNFDSADYEADVLIIGAGGAGCSAALEAQAAGASVLMVTKLRMGDANTMMAEGGIQAADKPNDSPVRHYLDAFGGGHFAARPELLRRLVMEAPDAIAWLEKLGVMFDKTEDGTMVTTHGGGTSRKRMHACADYTGAEIMRTLRDEVQNRKIPVLEFTSAVELLKDETGRVTGAVLLNMETGEWLIVRARTVILATGGAGRLHYQGFPHQQPLWGHGRWAGVGLPGGGAAVISRYDSVPPHRGRIPGPDFRGTGHRKSAVPGGHAGQPGRRSLHASAGNPRRGSRCHYPGM